MRSARRPGGWGSRKGLIRALSYGAAAVSCGWAGYSYHAIVVERSSAKTVGFAAAETAAAAEPREEAAAAAEAAVWEGNTSRAPWDPKGCQSVVFFHVPKTGGESVNALWVNMAGREQVSWWKEGYSLTSLRVTGLEPKKQEDLLRSM